VTFPGDTRGKEIKKITIEKEEKTMGKNKKVTKLKNDESFYLSDGNKLGELTRKLETVLIMIDEMKMSMRNSGRLSPLLR
jgi:hypothetical protein